MPIRVSMFLVVLFLKLSHHGGVMGVLHTPLQSRSAGFSRFNPARRF
jgi:hypothetical protein